MEVHRTPELKKKLNDLAALSGRPAGELVQDAVAGLSWPRHVTCWTAAMTISEAAG